MDERLVIPKLSRQIILRSLRYWHQERDSMLATMANMWSSRLHREAVGIAQTCQQCKIAGKNLKRLLRQRQIRKQECNEMNQEVSIDFAGSFQNAIGARNYLIVSIDHYSAWPEAKFLRKPNTEKVLEFLEKIITRHGIPRVLRTDPATIFRSRKYKQFCKRSYIRHVECPVRDHRGKGKIERLICSINETLRTNRKIIVIKDKTGLTKILFALRINPSATKKSPFQRHTGNEPNAIKRIVTNKQQCISGNQEVELDNEDFESGQDSAIMVRERTKGTKVEETSKNEKEC